MEEVFITKVKFDKILHLVNVEIDLSTDERKHLIITGKNGSGKTTLLKSITEFFTPPSQTGIDRLIRYSQQIKSYEKRIEDVESGISNMNPEIINLWKGSIEEIKEKLENDEKSDLVKFNNSISFVRLYQKGNFVLSFLNAKRASDIIKPTTIEKVVLQNIIPINKEIGHTFLKYLVFLRNQQLEAHFNNDFEKAKQFEEWFKNFEEALKYIYEDKSLKLEYDSRNLNYKIILSRHEPFDFTTLADGYSAFLKIIAEIILRMEGKSLAFDLQGIVLIDEIETHLHVSLQKKILPFLTTFFPRLQFIVTTHSPFIISSLENSIVYDLENKIRIDDASEFSYSSIVEEYLQAGSEYSTIVEEKMKIYEELTALSSRNEEQEKKLAELDLDLATLRPLLSSEMYIRYVSARKNIKA